MLSDASSQVAVTREVTWVDFLVALQSIVIGVVLANFARAYQFVCARAERIMRRSASKHKYRVLTADDVENTGVQGFK
jgi:hypothetical protein